MPERNAKGIDYERAARAFIFTSTIQNIDWTSSLEQVMEYAIDLSRRYQIEDRQEVFDQLIGTLKQLNEQGLDHEGPFDLLDLLTKSK
ncbi:hypothetical protein A3A76_04620 [Candidatus Woesebacteria bacterium RIFCSPLOWO2_01_FULL_39_23]|uniref:Uncharacterized protein n=1 Tax=Candidatus Woesebacteria bacterium RIFCSPHIGHO2_01_FULL_40_22 TaxID=1802499 RepID=A0A1F7YJY4_9BACT|nr:MAG: hypothetical protein A2141_06000 [Candidatus Woesebacteria bacterium RBG_16_40_11]OGM27656.1 MAG: hypothetical protein A2628_04255 [Candidatus Woesebacteria bacterium RIFCSPHIGHO2_01_FULL_40_22]OGM63484.1 MAG: hypothetical protein A3A76_04620 [Candidatus Woesebacteria bacterium RIFCSPLOWO2_01_FULL_39_23]